MTAIAIKNKDAILDRVAKGERITSICKTYKVSHAAISKQLSHDPEYIEANLCGATARIEQRTGELEAIKEGDSQVMLGRARELLAQARWEAERRFPAQWGGTKVNINVVGKIEMSEALEHEASLLLEHISKEE